MIGSCSHCGSAVARRVLLVRSEGQVCNRLFESCFHRGFGAVSIYQDQLKRREARPRSMGVPAFSSNSRSSSSLINSEM